MAFSRNDKVTFYLNLAKESGQYNLRNGDIITNTSEYGYNIAEYIDECLTKGTILPEAVMRKLVEREANKGSLGTRKNISMYRNVLVDGLFTVTRKRYLTNLLEIITPVSYKVFEVLKDEDGNISYKPYDFENNKNHRLYKVENIKLYQSYIINFISNNKDLFEKVKNKKTIK